MVSLMLFPSLLLPPHPCPSPNTQMGMGKTAVMISLMRMPLPAAWADTLAVPEAWDDAHTCVWLLSVSCH